MKVLVSVLQIIGGVVGRVKKKKKKSVDMQNGSFSSRLEKIFSTKKWTSLTSGELPMLKI